MGSKKKKIRQIQSDQELLDAFNLDDDVDSELNQNEAAELKLRKTSPAVEKRRSTPEKYDKNGFPVFDGSDDFSAMMAPHFHEDDILQEAESAAPVKDKLQKSSFKTRHGIQILEKGTDYEAVFQDDSPPDVFEELVSESLGEKSTAVLLKEKRDNMHPVRRKTEKQRLKRFPKPQGQIDLHGCSAIKADLTVESYLRNAYRNGTYTVRVIVGKGLHSQDGPVLPDIVEKRVLQLKKEEIVFAYEWEKKKKSKSGSLTVFLNNYSSV